MSNSNKRTVLVTGATGGLGTAMCKTLYKEGFLVVGNYHTKEKADNWISQMKSEGFDIKLFYGDVSDFDSAGEMIKKIEAEVGVIDTLVNNAGITRDGRLINMKKDDWYAVINTNLNSARAAPVWMGTRQGRPRGVIERYRGPGPKGHPSSLACGTGAPGDDLSRARP